MQSKSTLLVEVDLFDGIHVVIKLQVFIVVVICNMVSRACMSHERYFAYIPSIGVAGILTIIILGG